MDIFTKYLFTKAGKKYPNPIILMYHGTVISRKQQSFEYSIDSHRFSRQLDLLKKHGWHTACIRDLKKPDEIPHKTIILTFDDGFANNFEGAYLPLKERNMCATWFIVSGCVGSYSTWLKEDKNDKMLTIEQLLEMNANGMEIGAHTVSHKDLTILNEEEINHELTTSKDHLEKIIDSPVVSFAYPYGRFGDLAADCARKAGYSFACSVRPGWFSKNDDPFRIPRLTIFSHDSLGTFARKLIFASNEMSWKQMIRYYNSRLISQLKKRISFSRE